VRNLIPLEFHIQEPISADPKGIALVIKSGLVGIGIEIIIFLFSSDHQLQLRHNNALGDIPILFKRGQVPLKTPRQTADLSAATDGVVSHVYLPPRRGDQKQKEDQGRTTDKTDLGLFHVRPPYL